MKIAIICDPIDLDQKTGIPVYCERMVREFMKDKNNSYVFFHMKENSIFNGFENVIFSAWNSFWLWNALLSVWRKFFLIPRECRRRGIDVVHDLNMIGIHTFDFFRKYKAVVTIFDLTPLIFRQYHWWLNVLWFNLFVKRSAKKADRVIAISEATKKDLIRFFGIHPDKISVTLLWTDILEREMADTPNFSAPFILSVWTLEPRKNLRNLVKAFVKAKELWIWKDVKLVLTGKFWWKLESFLNELSLHSSLRNEIIITGFLTDEQLVHLYKTCTVFVYPSFYEGFWLPVLEAMTVGAPVITSNVSSIPEVAWNACLLCDPNDVNSIANSIVSVLHDPKIRKRLSCLGIEQSKKFSWQRCASETLVVYEWLQ